MAPSLFPSSSFSGSPLDLRPSPASDFGSTLAKRSPDRDVAMSSATPGDGQDRARHVRGLVCAEPVNRGGHFVNRPYPAHRHLVAHPVETTDDLLGACRIRER